MEVCQTGYYTEDFRTQEVPAGFDFASYGEFRASLLHQDSFDKRFKLSAMSCPDRRELRVLCFFSPRMFARSVSSEPERLKDRGNICADCIITSVRAFSGRPWHPGGFFAQTQGLRQDNGGLLCMCVCVNNAWMGWGRQRQGGQVKDTPLSVFPNPFLQTSSSNRFRAPLSLPIPPSLLCHTPSAGVSSSLFLPLPPLFPPSWLHPLSWKKILWCMSLSVWCWFDSKQVAFFFFSCVNIHHQDKNPKLQIHPISPHFLAEL